MKTKCGQKRVLSFQNLLSFEWSICTIIYFEKEVFDKAEEAIANSNVVIEEGQEFINMLNYTGYIPLRRRSEELPLPKIPVL